MTHPSPSRTPGRSRRTRLTVTVVVGTLLLGAIGVATALGLRSAADDPPAAAPRESPEVAVPSPPEEPAVPEPIRVIALGDMLPHDSVHQNARTAEGGWDYGQFFSGITEQLGAADVTFCNQEVPSAGEEFGITGYPVFNAPREFARDLHATVGCDLVNLATNHTADLGPAGIAATRAAWEEYPDAVVAGANRSAEEQRDVRVLEVDGVRIALVALAEYSNIAIDGVSLNLMGDTALVEDLMARARDTADVVIVSTHWGTEDSHEVNAQQQGFAQRLADLGADVVLGTGPHVLQPVVWLDRPDGGRTLVWYSLGNMLNTQIALAQRTGVIAGFDLVRESSDSPVRVDRPTAILTYMHYDWTAEQEAAYDLAARTSLGITPLADSADPLSRTRFGVTPEDHLAAQAAILGPVVEVLPR